MSLKWKRVKMVSGYCCKQNGESDYDGDGQFLAQEGFKISRNLINIKPLLMSMNIREF